MGDGTNLQRDLAALIQWLQNHNIKLYENKFESIHFGRKAAPKQPYIRSSDEHVTASNSAGKLGVTVDNRLQYTHKRERSPRPAKCGSGYSEISSLYTLKT